MEMYERYLGLAFGAYLRCNALLSYDRRILIIILRIGTFMEYWICHTLKRHFSNVFETSYKYKSRLL